MFFVVSKIVSYLLLPLTWIVGLWIAGLFSKRRKRKKCFLIGGFVLLLLFSNPFLLNECMRMWELKTIRTNKTVRYDYGILLGGMASFDAHQKQVNFHRAADRLLQTIKLYHTGQIDKILISGGAGSLFLQNQKEADFLKSYLLAIQIPEYDIVIENQSRNTRENALFTAQKLHYRLKNSDFLLITSAIHGRRAMACFHKAGIHPDFYATDRYSGQRKFALNHLLLPSVETLRNWEMLIHELVGFLIYDCIGYI